MYSKKVTIFCKISTVDLPTTTEDKSTVEISLKFVVFSEYMNFTKYSQIDGEDFVNFCGLLRNRKL